jgi:hypothetical protein
VNVLKVKLLLMIFLMIVFSSGRMAMAHGDDQKMQSTSSLNGNGQSGNTMEGMDMSGKDKNMDMSGKDKNMDMSGSKEGDSMEGMDMEEGGHGHEAVKEKPANQKVLGAFGAVNLSFIVIGVWNKWFRRKDDTGGNSN